MYLYTLEIRSRSGLRKCVFYTHYVMSYRFDIAFLAIFEVGELGRPIFTFNIHLRYKSGQYIWIQLPELSKFQWHPVSRHIT